jgi:hypothetical protein
VLEGAGVKDERELLAAFEPRRAVQVTEADAASLGSESLQAWSDAPADSWIVDVREYVQVRADAMRYRTLRLRLECLGMLFAGAAVVVALVAVLSLVFG